MGILNLRQTAKQKFRQIVVNAIGRGLIHKGRSNLEVLQGDQLLTIVVLAELPTGLLSRDGTAEDIEALGPERNRIGVEVDIGRHHFDLVFDLKHLVVEVDLGDIPLFKADFVQVLVFTTGENLEVVSHKGFGRRDAIGGHQRVKSKILIHSSTRLRM